MNEVDRQILQSGSVQAIVDRVRAIFVNRGVQIAQGTESESARLLRIAQEISRGQRDFDAVRSSVDSIAQGRTPQAPYSPSGPIANPGPSTVGNPAAVASEQGQRDAFASVKAVMKRYGLPDSLSAWAWEQIVQGRSEAEVMLELQDRQEFKQRFPSIGLRTAQNKVAVSPAEILDFERTATQLMRTAGLPPGFYDSPDDFTNFLVNDVSAAELRDRIDEGYVAALQAPADVRNALRTMYGINEGALAAYFLDPDRALPAIQRQFAAAQVSGAASRTGFGALNQTEAERLAALGVSGQEAQEGFSALQESTELFGVLPGEQGAGVTRGEQIGAAFEGNAAAKGKIDSTRRKRLAAFEGGGGYASDQSGFGGLGTAR